MIAQWSKADLGYSKEALYEVMGTTRQAESQARHRMQHWQERSARLLDQVEAIRSRHPRMGSRPLYFMLKDPEMGITAFERLMSRQGLTVARKKKYKVTTQSRADRRFPNRTNGLILTDMNQLIVGDITYLYNSSGWYYVYTLKDMYSKRLVGLEGSDSLKSENAVACFEQVKQLRGEENIAGMIHHTDGGVQYRSDLYLQELWGAKVVISQANNCLENGAAEQSHDTVKNQYLLAEEIGSVDQLKRALEKIKYLINHERPVEALGYKTPVEFEQMLPNVPIEHRPQVKCHDFTNGKSTERFFEAFTPGMIVDICSLKNQLQSNEKGAEVEVFPKTDDIP